MKKSINVITPFLCLCAGWFVFNSSVVFALDEKKEIRIQEKSNAEKIITDYAGEEASNQFKENMKSLEGYYEEINKKLHKENNKTKKINSDNRLEETAKKSLIESINVGDMDVINKKVSEYVKAIKAVNDEQLLDLMKQAGVDKNQQTSDTNDKETPVIKIYRDPFSLTRTLTGGGRLIEDSLPFAQKSFAEKIPKMVLKGVVKKPDGTRVALLEIDDKVTYMVKENDRVGLSALGLRMVIHIQEIHENTIIVEPGEINAGQEGEVIVVR